MTTRSLATGPFALDDIVARLRLVHRSAGWDKVDAIAEVLIDGAFGGDVDLCRTSGRHASSLRRIAKHPDCPYRKTRLAEVMGVYLVCQQAPFIRTCRNIGPSHVAAVLPLAEDERIELLRRAEAERLSVRDLRELVVGRRRARGERRGRPAQDRGTRATAAARRALAALRVAHDHLERMESLTPDEWEELESHLEGAIRMVAALRKLAHQTRPSSRPTSIVVQRGPRPLSKATA